MKNKKPMKKAKLLAIVVISLYVGFCAGSFMDQRIHNVWDAYGKVSGMSSAGDAITLGFDDGSSLTFVGQPSPPFLVGHTYSLHLITIDNANYLCWSHDFENELETKLEASP